MAYYQQMLLATHFPVAMRYRGQCPSFHAEPCLFPLWINTFGQLAFTTGI